MFVKEKFEEMLANIRLGMTTEISKDYGRFMSKLQDATFWGKLVWAVTLTSLCDVWSAIETGAATENAIAIAAIEICFICSDPF